MYKELQMFGVTLHIHISQMFGEALHIHEPNVMSDYLLVMCVMVWRGLNPKKSTLFSAMSWGLTLILICQSI